MKNNKSRQKNIKKNVLKKENNAKINKDKISKENNSNKLSGSKLKKKLWHSKAMEHETNYKPMVCRFIITGGCKNDNCRFSHDITPDQIIKFLEPCKYYANNECLKTDLCNFMHGEFPCLFYHGKRGTIRCTKGSSCRFNHDPLTPEMEKALQNYLDKEKVRGQTNEIIPSECERIKPIQENFGSIFLKNPEVVPEKNEINMNNSKLESFNNNLLLNNEDELNKSCKNSQMISFNHSIFSSSSHFEHEIDNYSLYVDKNIKEKEKENNIFGLIKPSNKLIFSTYNFNENKESDQNFSKKLNQPTPIISLENKQIKPIYEHFGSKLCKNYELDKNKKATVDKIVVESLEKNYYSSVEVDGNSNTLTSVSTSNKRKLSFDISMDDDEESNDELRIDTDYINEIVPQKKGFHDTINVFMDNDLSRINSNYTAEDLSKPNNVPMDDDISEDELRIDTAYANENFNYKMNFIDQVKQVSINGNVHQNEVIDDTINVLTDNELSRIDSNYKHQDLNKINNYNTNEHMDDGISEDELRIDVLENQNNMMNISDQVKNFKGDKRSNILKSIFDNNNLENETNETLKVINVNRNKTNEALKRINIQENDLNEMSNKSINNIGFNNKNKKNIFENCQNKVIPSRTTDEYTADIVSSLPLNITNKSYEESIELFNKRKEQIKEFLDRNSVKIKSNKNERKKLKNLKNIKCAKKVNKRNKDTEVLPIEIELDDFDVETIFTDNFEDMTPLFNNLSFDISSSLEVKCRKDIKNGDIDDNQIKIQASQLLDVSSSVDTVVNSIMMEDATMSSAAVKDIEMSSSTLEDTVTYSTSLEGTVEYPKASINTLYLLENEIEEIKKCYDEHLIQCYKLPYKFHDPRICNNRHALKTDWNQWFW